MDGQSERSQNNVMKKMRNTGVDVILNNKALFILIIVCGIVVLKEPIFFSPENLMNVIRQIAVSAILGIGFTMVLASGSMDLSVGTMVGMLGVITAMLSKIEGIPFIVVVILSFAIGGLCGLFNGFVGTKFKLPLFIVTLATGLVFKGACMLLSNTSPITGIPDTFKKIDQGYFGPIPIPVYIMVVVGVIISTILYMTKFGRYAVAIGGNEEAARVSGINVNKIRIGVYIIMGICAAIAALILTGRAASAQPAAGQGMEMDAIAAVVMGGTPLKGGSGKVVGTVFGCLIVGVINNGLNLMGVDSNWQLVAKGFLIIFAVLMDVQTEQFFAGERNKIVS